MSDAAPLAHQVAQRMMLGYEGAQPSESLRSFLAMGLGGVLFFRRNFEALVPQTPEATAQLLADIRAVYQESGFAAPFLALDQEGGLIERLPYTVFPPSISPMAVARALRDDASNEFCAEVYDLQAFYLSLLGFNVNFFPTLDVNGDPPNPVIGVRAFGDDPDIVWRFASVVLERMTTRHLLAVGKHFPGHGSGTVDSHEALPTLTYSEAELAPFRQAIEAGLPAMMLSHGYYPSLQDAAGEGRRPASLSKRVAQGLLRDELGFDGVIFSDDMTMGALREFGEPVACALAALEAGVDMLVYRDCGERERHVHEAICQALQDGRLSMEAHQASLARIQRAKSRVSSIKPQPALAAQVMTPQAIEAVSDFIAMRALRLSSSPDLHETRISLPLTPEDLFWLIVPDRQSIAHYAYEAHDCAGLADWLEAGGLYPLTQIRYSPAEPVALPEPSNETPDVILFVTYNPLQHPTQAACYEALRARFPQSAIILAQAGGPCPEALMPQADLRIDLFGYRPPTIKALALALSQAPSTPAVRPPAQKPMMDPDEEDVEYELAEEDASY
ncbi:MAG: hypothetical protein IPK79_07890 [Vampirovibrionales bacterium]|nr:hypothetical protein [Vampirovibrionales bacterium]